MLRVHRVMAAERGDIGACQGTVTLDFNARHRRRARLETDAGTALMLDLPHAVVLGDGDRLITEDGGHVIVRAAVEACVAITADTPERLARIAWHIGNRHFPAELRAGSIVIPDDHVIVDMVRGLGGAVRPLRTVFNPERGAYGHDH